LGAFQKYAEFCVQNAVEPQKNLSWAQASKFGKLQRWLTTSEPML
jgi:hypothetical protein